MDQLQSRLETVELQIIIALFSGKFNDLRHERYQSVKNPATGHCYVAAEVMFHLGGGSAAGLKPMFIKHEGQPHWYVSCGLKYYDSTASQFSTWVPYLYGTGKGFLTKSPSKRAKQFIERMTGNK